MQSVISELAEKAMNSRITVPDRLDDLIHTVACKAAIKAGKPTTMTELQDLCERVLSDDNVRSCPHMCIRARAMGSRLIRQWIEKPLYNPLHIAPVS